MAYRDNIVSVWRRRVSVLAGLILCLLGSVAHAQRLPLCLDALKSLPVLPLSLTLQTALTTWQQGIGTIKPSNNGSSMAFSGQSPVTLPKNNKQIAAYSKGVSITGSTSCPGKAEPLCLLSFCYSDLNLIASKIINAHPPEVSATSSLTEKYGSKGVVVLAPAAMGALYT